MTGSEAKGTLMCNVRLMCLHVKMGDLEKNVSGCTRRCGRRGGRERKGEEERSEEFGKVGRREKSGIPFPRGTERDSCTRILLRVLVC